MCTYLSCSLHTHVAYATYMQQHTTSSFATLHAEMPCCADEGAFGAKGAAIGVSRCSVEPACSWQPHPCRAVLGCRGPASPPNTTLPQTTAAAATSALAQPSANSTSLLAAKIDQMERQAFDADAALQDSDVQQRANAAAAVAANVPLNAVLYHNLEPVDDAQGPIEGARLVSKQLHPAWVAKRHMKPSLQDLWRVSEQHVAVLSTDVAQHHVRLSRKYVANELLQLT